MSADNSSTILNKIWDAANTAASDYNTSQQFNANETTQFNTVKQYYRGKRTTETIYEAITSTIGVFSDEEYPNNVIYPAIAAEVALDAAVAASDAAEVALYAAEIFANVAANAAIAYGAAVAAAQGVADDAYNTILNYGGPSSLETYRPHADLVKNAVLLVEEAIDTLLAIAATLPGQNEKTRESFSTSVIETEALAYHGMSRSYGDTYYSLYDSQLTEFYYHTYLAEWQQAGAEIVAAVTAIPVLPGQLDVVKTLVPVDQVYQPDYWNDLPDVFSGWALTETQYYAIFESDEWQTAAENIQLAIAATLPGQNEKTRNSFSTSEIETEAKEYHYEAVYDNLSDSQLTTFYYIKYLEKWQQAGAEIVAAVTDIPFLRGQLDVVKTLVPVDQVYQPDYWNDLPEVFSGWRLTETQYYVIFKSDEWQTAAENIQLAIAATLPGQNEKTRNSFSTSEIETEAKEYNYKSAYNKLSDSQLTTFYYIKYLEKWQQAGAEIVAAVTAIPVLPGQLDVVKTLVPVDQVYQPDYWNDLPEVFSGWRLTETQYYVIFKSDELQTAAENIQLAIAATLPGQNEKTRNSFSTSEIETEAKDYYGSNTQYTQLTPSQLTTFYYAKYLEKWQQAGAEIVAAVTAIPVLPGQLDVVKTLVPVDQVYQPDYWNDLPEVFSGWQLTETQYYAIFKSDEWQTAAENIQLAIAATLPGQNEKTRNSFSTSEIETEAKEYHYEAVYDNLSDSQLTTFYYIKYLEKWQQAGAEIVAAVTDIPVLPGQLDVVKTLVPVDQVYQPDYWNDLPEVFSGWRLTETQYYVIFKSDELQTAAENIQLAIAATLPGQNEKTRNSFSTSEIETEAKEYNYKSEYNKLSDSQLTTFYYIKYLEKWQQAGAEIVAAVTAIPVLPGQLDVVKTLVPVDQVYQPDYWNDLPEVFSGWALTEAQYYAIFKPVKWDEAAENIQLAIAATLPGQNEKTRNSFSTSEIETEAKDYYGSNTQYTQLTPANLPHSIMPNISRNGNRLVQRSSPQSLLFRYFRGN